jgi:hypothetical protein
MARSTHVSLSVVFVGLALTSLAAGCNLEQRYLMPDGGRTYAAAILETTPPFIVGEEESLYVVETRVDFPVHAPTDMEMAELGNDVVPPFARRPWVQRDDYAVEVDLVVSNLEPTPQTITVTVNGINEFNEYVPSAAIVDDDLVIDFAQWERTYRLEAGERRIVTVREEELDEIAVDLASVVNMVDGVDCGYQANQIVYFMNQSSLDPRSMACVPAMIPGLVGVKVGVRATGGIPDPVTMVTIAPRAAVEASIRLRDLRNRVASGSEVPWTLPVPTPFTPLIMMEPVP